MHREPVEACSEGDILVFPETDQMLWFACFTELSGNDSLSLQREIKRDPVANNGSVLKNSLSCKRFNMHDTHLSFNERKELNLTLVLQAPSSRFAPK